MCEVRSVSTAVICRNPNPICKKQIILTSILYFFQYPEFIYSFIIIFFFFLFSLEILNDVSKFYDIVFTFSSHSITTF